VLPMLSLLLALRFTVLLLRLRHGRE
jgi:hypothetical protein